MSHAVYDHLYIFRTNNAYVYVEFFDHPTGLSSPLLQPTDFASTIRKRKALELTKLNVPPPLQGELTDDFEQNRQEE